QLICNGTLVASATDAALTTDSIGMRSLVNAKFDNFNGKAIFTDTFTQNTGTPLNASTWTRQAGAFGAANNAMASGSTFNLATQTGLSQADVRVEADATLATNGFIGLVARNSGPDYYMAVVIDSGGVTYAA